MTSLKPLHGFVANIFDVSLEDPYQDRLIGALPRICSRNIGNFVYFWANSLSNHFTKMLTRILSYKSTNVKYAFEI